MRFDPSRKDFNKPVRLRAVDVARARKASATPLQADATARAQVARIATAYEKAVDPGSSDDPCPYLSAAARADVIDDPPSEAPAGGCTTLIRCYERDRASPPKRLGGAELDLRTLVSVPGASGGNLADGAGVRFAAIPNDAIGLVHEGGQWRIAEYR